MAAMTLALAQQAGASGVEGEDSVQRGSLQLTTLFVRTRDGWEPIHVTAPPHAAVLPLRSLSEIIVRPDIGLDGIEIATLVPTGGVAPELAVDVYVHAANLELAQLGSEFWLLEEVGLVEPPLRAERIDTTMHPMWDVDGWSLAARRDGLVAALDLAEIFERGESLDELSLVAYGPLAHPRARSGATSVHHDSGPDAWLQFLIPPQLPTWVALAGPLASRAEGTVLAPWLEGPADDIRGIVADHLFLARTTTAPSAEPIDERIRAVAAIPPNVLQMLGPNVEVDSLSFVVERFRAPTTEGRISSTIVVRVADPGEARAVNCDPRMGRQNRSKIDAAALVDVRGSPGLRNGHLRNRVHVEGSIEQLDIRPTMGPGAAWGDLDADGRPDLYLVQGAGRPGTSPPINRIFENCADGFYDSTDDWGGADTGAGMGALFFDADGDRDLDLFVANYGADVLFDNRMADGVPNLVDVSAAAGVGADLWSAGICAGDVDNDGDLDLYVTSYLEYDESQMPSLEDLPYQREDPVAMLPFAFPGQRNQLLINESTADGLRFVDRAKEWRVVDEAGRGMQPIMFDFDRDGWLDLYVANDVSPNVLYKNNRDGRFRDVSFATGMDDPRGGMGVALGDVDLDGDEDLFLTNWELEPNALYTSNLLTHASQRHRVATFRDTIVPSGLGPHGVGVTSWAAVFFDLENDGDLDLYVANGYTSPDYESTGICVAQPDHLFTNDGRGKFTVAHDLIAPFAANGGRDLPSRCAIDCDFDRDGDVDLFVTANNSAYRLLENRAERKGHWLGVRLAAPAPNTYAVGARVEVVTDRRTFVRTLLAGSGYMGGNAPELHFGLGACERIERVVVHPPGTNAAGDGPASPITFTPADTPALELDAWVTLDLR